MDKFCKDCEHCGGDLCTRTYITPEDGWTRKLTIREARRSECFCGADGKFYSPKKKYITLDKVWTKWAAAGMCQEVFENTFKHLGEWENGIGKWLTHKQVAHDCTCWGLAGNYHRYRVLKSEVPKLPEPEYITLEDLWELMDTNKFKEIFRTNPDVLWDGGGWCLRDSPEINWTFQDGLHNYKIAKTKVPVPDCPHCGHHGGMISSNGGIRWECCNCCLRLAHEPTRFEAIKLFYKLLGGSNAI